MNTPSPTGSRPMMIPEMRPSAVTALPSPRTPLRSAMLSTTLLSSSARVPRRPPGNARAPAPLPAAGVKEQHLGGPQGRTAVPQQQRHLDEQVAPLRPLRGEAHRPLQEAALDERRPGRLAAGGGAVIGGEAH